MTDIKYVAFDVHQATISAAVLSLEGQLLTQAVMQTEASAIRDFLRGLSGRVHLTFEEGTQAQWLYDLSRPLVSEVLVCNPRLNHSKPRANKSDRLDAFNLARGLRAGLLKSVYHGSPQTQTLKQLAHNYETLTEDTTRCMNRLKAVYRSQAGMSHTVAIASHGLQNSRRSAGACAPSFSTSSLTICASYDARLRKPCCKRRGSRRLSSGCARCPDWGRSGWRR
jgi:hypothetical protein